MRLSQQKLNQNQMSGSRLKRFLEKSQIKKGSIVKSGWYYRNVPYVDEESPVYIVLDDPRWDSDHYYWKPYQRKGEWREEEIVNEPGFTVTIMENGKHYKTSLYNLVNIGVYNE